MKQQTTMMLAILLSFLLVGCSNGTQSKQEEKVDATLDATEKQDAIKQVEEPQVLKDDELLVIIDGEEQIVTAKSELTAFATTIKVVGDPKKENTYGDRYTIFEWPEESPYHVLQFGLYENKYDRSSLEIDMDKKIKMRFLENMTYSYNGKGGPDENTFVEEVNLHEIGLEDTFSYGFKAETVIGDTHFVKALGLFKETDFGKPMVEYRFYTVKPKEKKEYSVMFKYLKEKETPEFTAAMFAMLKSHSVKVDN
ncbi:hypothetical protein EJF36_05130 [Bacillus sp. HMF5848]|uniref:hypothetical protein n=1 Tax=Bacillus sp. HMF5848 TaxID=2495421 RepID=UPI000F769603|nr:hypothetical protein [Bacillus sp. HMF5848]RSK26290.1 hypothetical protein EJF36_05130 [Bacillus sp. HMF5848]